MHGKEFVRAWCADPAKEGRCGSLSVRDGYLRSYEVPIAEITPKECVLISGCFSKTTNKHISYVHQAWKGNFSRVASL